MKLAETLRARGSLPPELGEWVAIPLYVRIMCWQIVADRSAGALRIWLRRCRNKCALGAIRRAALAADHDGTPRRSWSSDTARRIAALGLALVELGKSTRRKGAWSSLVRGLPVTAFCSLLKSPWEIDGPALHPSTLSGFHRGVFSAAERGELGYLTALRRAGLFSRQQLPAHECEPFERCGPSGHACNRYWIVTAEPRSPREPSRRAELTALHEAGWDALIELERRAARQRAAGAHELAAPRSARATAAPS